MHSSLLRRSLAVAVLLVVSPFVSAAGKPASPSRVDHLIEALFTAPEFRLGKLSPDGAYLAFLQNVGERNALDTYEFKTGKLYRLGRQDGVYGFDWIGPNRILFFFLGDYRMSDATLKRIDSIDSPLNKVLILGASLPRNPDTAYFYEPGLFGPIWRLDKKKRTLYQYESNPGKAVGWAFDHAGVPRLASVAEDHSQWSYLYRDTREQPWQPLKLPAQTEIVTFDSSDKNVLVSYPGPSGLMQLQQFDLQTKQLNGDPITDPVYDLNPGTIADNRTGTPVGLVYEAERTKYVWLSSQYGQLHAALQKLNPAGVVHLIGLLESGEMLFATTSDVLPVVLYRVDVPKMAIKPIAVSLPGALHDTWAPMQPVTFPARDGHPLHGYLTLPLQLAAGQKVPLIALSHGGPVTRDIWGFDPEVQFFAALGYAVLQVNYRGSSGYGRPHELPNLIEVCDKSVDDVVDGIRWAIAQGYANPAKVVAYGGSYGGYISLGIATRYPEVPAAVVSFAGVYDWESQLKDDKKTSWSGTKFFKWREDYYLDPKIHAERYRAFSPALFANQVRCPVLLLHGGQDRVVDISQTNKMSRALRDAGKNVEVIKDAESGHGWSDWVKLQNYYRTLAAYLQKHVPPDAAP